MHKLYEGAAADWAGCQDMQNGLIESLGWIGDDGDDAAVDVLEPLANYRSDPSTIMATRTNFFNGVLSLTSKSPRYASPETVREAAISCPGQARAASGTSSAARQARSAAWSGGNDAP